MSRSILVSALFCTFSNCGKKLSCKINKTGMCRYHYLISHTGKNAIHWKGGVKINTQGYILLYLPKHPYKDQQGYVREHRIIMEKYLGRFLRKNEVVHHINGNKKDNRIENLQLLNKKDHDRLERYKRKSFDRTGCIPWNKGLRRIYVS